MLDLILISIALGADAFGVTFSLGISKKIKKNYSIAIIIFFGFFQFLFSYLGGIFGNIFNKYVFLIPSLFSGIIITTIGIIMLKEGISKKKDVVDLNFIMIPILGICVSIDALVVGFSSFNRLNKYLLFKYCLIVGIITSIMCLIAILIGKTVKKINSLSKFFGVISGIILIFLGLKMIFL